MKQPDHRDEDRRPRRIEHRLDALATEEAAELAEIAQHLGTDWDTVQPPVQAGADHRAGHLFLDPPADPRQDPAARHLQPAKHQQCEGDDQRKEQQRVGAAARQDAVEDLHHVERRDEHQQVDAETEQPDDDKAEPDLRERSLKFRLHRLAHRQTNSRRCLGN